MKTSFAIQGIDRSRPNNISGNDPQASVDGACQEMVNLRYYNNAWRPMGDKKVAWANFPLASYNGLYLHHTGGGDDIWVAYSGSNVYYYASGGVRTITDPDFNGSELEFSSMGNVLIINNKTKNRISWAIFKKYVQGDIGFGYDRYEYIKEIPDIGLIDYKSTTKEEDIGMVFAFSNSTDANERNKELTDQVLAGLVKTNAEKLEEYNLANGLLLLQCALELVDGSVIKHTPLTCISLVDTPYIIDKYEGYQAFWLKFYYGKLELSYKGVNYDMLKDVVKSINVYSSRVIPILNMTSPITDFVRVEAENIQFNGNINESLRDFSFVENEATLYKVATLTLEDAEKARTTPYRVNLKSIETNEVMQPDNGSHHTLGASNVNIYNDRLVLSDVKVNLYMGFPSSLFTENPDGKHPQVRLVDKGTTYFLQRDSSLSPNAGGAESFILSYPDIRASQIGYCYQAAEGLPGYYWYVIYYLKPHPTLNIAYGISKKSPKELEIYNNADVWSYFTNGSSGLLKALMKTLDQIDPADNQDGGAIQRPVGPSENTVIQDGNRIQLTEVSAPFDFPAKLSYRMDGEVIGIAFNTLPISQGQFGEHPMLAATTTGWKALTIGTGEVYITSIVPLNGLVVNNPKSIINCDRDIVFTTDRGLFIMRGSETILISKPMEEGTSKADMDMGQMITHPMLGNFSADPRSTILFLQYIKDANYAYDIKENELIVSNPNYGYSYFFDFDTQFWYKKSETYLRFANSYPKVYSVRGNDLIEISEEVGGSQSILIVTRALRMGTEKFKRVEKMVCNGHIYTDAEKYCRCALYLSYDGTKFQMVDAKDMQSRALNASWLASHYGAKYFTLVFCGIATPEAYFTTVDVESEETIGN